MAPRFQERARSSAPATGASSSTATSSSPNGNSILCGAFLDATDTRSSGSSSCTSTGTTACYLGDAADDHSLRGCASIATVPDIEVWGDGANVRCSGREHDADTVRRTTFDVPPLRQRAAIRAAAAEVAHAGRAARRAEPPMGQGAGLVFNMFPHRWDDGDFIEDLAIYEGEHIAGGARGSGRASCEDDFWVSRPAQGRGDAGNGPRMKLSVVVPVYNEAATVCQLIELVRTASESTTSTEEIIVVDDGSSDGTLRCPSRAAGRTRTWSASFMK